MKSKEVFTGFFADIARDAGTITKFMLEKKCVNSVIKAIIPGEPSQNSMLEKSLASVVYLSLLEIYSIACISGFVVDNVYSLYNFCNKKTRDS